MDSLLRFIKAQEEGYANAYKEIKNGMKISHWVWYIFPQIKGLGNSPMSKYYAIENIEEAKAYLQNEYLKNNLENITKAFLSLETNDPEKVLGKIDALKVKSCMTLFASISEENSIYHQVLAKYYKCKMDEKTVKILSEKYDML